MTPTWLTIAEQELGIAEVPGKGNHPRILEYHDATVLHDRAAGRDSTPWCGSFVAWVLTEAGYKIAHKSFKAASWLHWGAEEVDPKLGAICVIRRRERGPDKATGSGSGYHVGFVAEGLRQRGLLKLLGGNQRDQVKYSNYPLERYEVKGYRWPIERIET
jgi:uncharacterized protein (TIGR02594 family)